MTIAKKKIDPETTVATTAEGEPDEFVEKDEKTGDLKVKKATRRTLKERGANKDDKLAQTGAVRRGNLFFYDPDSLEMEEDEEGALFDERVKMKLPEVFINDIARGIHTPITVRKEGERKDGTPIIRIVKGRQRVKAARIVNERLRKEGMPEDQLLLVPATFKKMDDIAAIEMMLSENEMRFEDEILTKARKAQRALDRGVDPQRVADLFKVDTQTINKWTSILECTPKVQEAFSKGFLTIGACKQLARLPRKEQDAKLEEILAQAKELVVDQAKAEQAKVQKVKADKAAQVSQGELLTEAPAPESKEPAKEIEFDAEKMAKAVRKVANEATDKIKATKDKSKKKAGRARNMGDYNDLVDILAENEPDDEVATEVHNALVTFLDWSMGGNGKEMKELFKRFGLEFPEHLIAAKF